jgi:hypothetical protein
MADRRTTSERGYGAEHQAEKERWRPIVDAGEAYCAEVVCLEERDGRSRWLEPGTPWHLAHADGQQGYRGAAHERCNTSEGARRGNAARGQSDEPTPTLWWQP